ncbi:unnamed protein product [Chondrus crispus]|uniref:Uncharacterized protein n=1 Tax=Chondrus crispus TaxID=2769 RepID=R7QH67_CHOCR|nr:unnamed protein product [Chondrus crispus]CDF36770.1 unnamed protein product [Chondrus crispus]|eukprot:XP_005716589.1 unnamed protein product [Chondrus crispus]
MCGSTPVADKRANPRPMKGSAEEFAKTLRLANIPPMRKLKDPVSISAATKQSEMCTRM